MTCQCRPYQNCNKSIYVTILPNKNVYKNVVNVQVRVRAFRTFVRELKAKRRSQIVSLSSLNGRDDSHEKENRIVAKLKIKLLVCL